LSNRSRQDLFREAIEAYREMQLGSELFDDVAAQILGVNRTDMRVMDVLQRRGAMTAGALADEIRLSRPAMTTALDRLEERRYVRRFADPADRRRVLVELTDHAMERSEEIWGDFFDFARTEAKHYSVAELEGMLRFSRRAIAENTRQLDRLEELLHSRAG
jgi:DNA-binding MarR family transcriptional regulator